MSKKLIFLIFIITALLLVWGIFIRRDEQKAFVGETIIGEVTYAYLSNREPDLGYCVIENKVVARCSRDFAEKVMAVKKRNPNAAVMTRADPSPGGHRVVESYFEIVEIDSLSEPLQKMRPDRD